MKIGITQRVEVVADYGERRDCLDQQWFQLAHHLGLTPVPVPNGLPDPRQWFADMGVEGFILSGGNDPAVLPQASRPAPERDATEGSALDYAREKKLPVLGVCRGLQMINLYFQGRLSPVTGHAGTRHPLKAVTDVPLFDEFQEVNSFHNWGITTADLGQPLRPCLLSHEGGVEAVQHPNLPWIGIMWHPEREQPFLPADLRLMHQLFRGEL